MEADCHSGTCTEHKTRNRKVKMCTCFLPVSLKFQLHQAKLYLLVTGSEIVRDVDTFYEGIKSIVCPQTELSCEQHSGVQCEELSSVV